MPTHKSAEKRNRQYIKRRDNNRMTKSAVRTAISRVRTAVSKGEIKEAEAMLREAERLIAKAATKKVLHSKNAARKVSRLTALVKASGKK